MSKAREEGREEIISKGEAIELLKKEIRRLERKLAAYRAILQMLEGGEEASQEKGEEIRVGRKRVGRLVVGEDFVKLIIEAPQLPQLVAEYLNGLEKDLRELQMRSGTAEGESLAKISVKERHNEVEVRIDNIYTTIELIKAKAGLKYAAEATHEIMKAKEE